MPTTTARQPTPNANTMNAAGSISQRYRGKHSATERFSGAGPPDLRLDIPHRAEIRPRYRRPVRRAVRDNDRVFAFTPFRRHRGIDPATVTRAVDELELSEAVYKTCPWEPRDLVATGLRQWLRCCGAAMADGKVIGMPSHAVDEAWHGLILCTRRYARFCERAYGQFLHHYPDGDGNVSGGGQSDDTASRLGRTVVAWSLVARPGEECVLWDLDSRLGLAQPWGIPAERVASIEAGLRQHAVGR